MKYQVTLKNAAGRTEKKIIDADDIGLMSGSGGEGSVDFIFFWIKVEVPGGTRKAKQQVIKYVIPAVNLLEVDEYKEPVDVNIKSLPRNTKEGTGGSTPPVGAGVG